MGGYCAEEGEKKLFWGGAQAVEGFVTVEGHRWQWGGGWVAMG